MAQQETNRYFTPENIRPQHPPAAAIRYGRWAEMEEDGYVLRMLAHAGIYYVLKFGKKDEG